MLLSPNNKIMSPLFLLVLFLLQSPASMAEINFDNVITEAEESKGKVSSSVTFESEMVEEAWEVQLELQDSEREDGERREEYREDHPNCESSDKSLCVDLIPTDSDYRFEYECAYGQSTGKKGKVCGKSNGKWANSCSITSVFAHHYRSPEAAAISACDL